MPKLNAIEPLSGGHVNLLDWQVWVSYLLGFGFLVTLWNVGRTLYGKLVGEIPAVGQFGTAIPLYQEPRATPVRGDAVSGAVTWYGEEG
jgi:hypothetical protein